MLDAPGPVKVTRIALPPQYAAVSFSPLTVTVVASYPGIVLWYEGVYVTFNAPAWQAATAPARAQAVRGDRQAGCEAVHAGENQ